MSAADTRSPAGQPAGGVRPRVRPTGPSTPPAWPSVLRAADEFYILAHDYRTGQPLLHERPLGLGTAGALLSELVLADLVSLPGGMPTVITDGLKTLAALQPPQAGRIVAAADRLAAAADRVAELRGTDAERCARDAALLEEALRHHDDAGDEPCPVCGAGVLDERWHTEVARRVAELQAQALDARAAGAELRAALADARALLPAPPAVLSRLAELGLPTQAPDVWTAYRDAPEEPAALAAHLRVSAAGFVRAVEDLAAAAETQRVAREDVWRPLALGMAGWLGQARTGQDQERLQKDVDAGLAWLKQVANDWANDRLAPLAGQSAAIWAQLRQESNVALGPVRLAGSATRRRVELDVTVDGSDSSALGVMSQGELHALALSLFLPRATVPASPFRFLVIDDPIQAMDPAKVDAVARVFAQVAERRQVVVFTHDDRLPAAVRRLQLPATVLEVNRRERSVVEIVVSEDQALRYLSDADALTRDDQVDAGIAARIVPGLCRLALEAACLDKIRAVRLGRGVAHTEVERLLEDNPKLYPRMALALFDDQARANDVLARLNRVGRWAGDAFKDCNAGAHSGADPLRLRDLVVDTRRLLAEVRA